MTFDMALRRMKYDQITTHGFRSTFRDWCEEKTNFANSVVLVHVWRKALEENFRHVPTITDATKNLESFTHL